MWEIFNPLLLANGKDDEAIYIAIQRRFSVTREEFKQLYGGDIPYFCCRTNEKTIFFSDHNSSGVDDRIRNETPMQTIAKNFKNFSRSNMEKSLKDISQALGLFKIE